VYPLSKDEQFCFAVHEVQPIRFRKQRTKTSWTAEPCPLPSKTPLPTRDAGRGRDVRGDRRAARRAFPLPYRSPSCSFDPEPRGHSNTPPRFPRPNRTPRVPSPHTKRTRCVPRALFLLVRPPRTLHPVLRRLRSRPTTCTNRTHISPHQYRPDAHLSQQVKSCISLAP
jgi:hypothetical protein